MCQADPETLPSCPAMNKIQLPSIKILIKHRKNWYFVKDWQICINDFLSQIREYALDKRPNNIFCVV